MNYFEKVKTFIERNPGISHPATVVTKEEIKEMEEKLQVSFPNEYRAFLENYGSLYFIGGYYEYLGVRTYGSRQPVVVHTLYCRSTGLPHSYIVFATDEGDEYLCLDTAIQNSSISIWNPFEKEFDPRKTGMIGYGSFFEQIWRDIENFVIKNAKKMVMTLSYNIIEKIK